jgi:DNA gyrase/topoisomerase IV subunit A
VPSFGGRFAIIVTEIPYQVNKTNLLERIAELARDGKLEGISDLRDESDRTGMRIVIEVEIVAFLKARAEQSCNLRGNKLLTRPHRTIHYLLLV